ncbi:50S ribosome-binding GTPase [Clostridiaceae bacterium 35-E11]
MKKCLIIGRPNAGKTLFMLNFAQYLGFKNIKIKFQSHDCEMKMEEYIIEIAKEKLSSSTPYKTTCLQSIALDFPVFKGKKTVEILDSSGLIDGIHNNIQIRRAMGQTLAAIKESDLILHIIDVSNLVMGNLLEMIGKVDYELAQYGLIKEGYVILGNKIDLLENKTPIIRLQKEFPNHYIIPISALTKQGFSEVKTYVSRRL